MTKKLTIAIDGPAASGKSTTARLLAEKLGYIYIDTGAMYRAASLAVIKSGINPADPKAVVNIVKKSRIELKIIDGIQHTFLDNEDVSDKIRTPEIDKIIHVVATNAEVRRIMVNYQRKTAAVGGVVMDGRDIGTIVLPNADLKIFMQASIEARAQRRKKDQSVHNISFDEIKKEIARRDLSDMTRKESPLVKADDAIELDNSELTVDQQVNTILGWISEL